MVSRWHTGRPAGRLSGLAEPLLAGEPLWPYSAVGQIGLYSGRFWLPAGPLGYSGLSRGSSIWAHFESGPASGMISPGHFSGPFWGPKMTILRFHFFTKLERPFTRVLDRKDPNGGRGGPIV